MKYYSYILAFHLISVVLWISSMFYMQRLVLLYTKNKNSTILKEGFFIYKRLANPTFLLSIILGLTLIISNKELLSSGFWIYIKFFFVSLIILIHHLCKINLEQLKSNTFKTKKQNISYHSFAPFVLLALVIFLTLTKAF